MALVSEVIARSSCSGDKFKVSGRGELQITVLAENMRREDFEFSISRAQSLVFCMDVGAP